MKYYIIYILLILIFYLSKYINKSKIDREKITAYECGFQEFDEARKKYYIKFYIVAIIFLIFDLEILLLYPITVNIFYFTSYIYILFLIFITILYLGLIYEINKSIII